MVEGEVIRVAWTRAEISAMREAVELTPYFEGRPAAVSYTHLTLPTN